jgi:hypothetical protein
MMLTICQIVGMYDRSPEAGETLRQLVENNRTGLVGLRTERIPRRIIVELRKFGLIRPISPRADQPTTAGVRWAEEHPK